jgi:hypothetical protein
MHPQGILQWAVQGNLPYLRLDTFLGSLMSFPDNPDIAVTLDKDKSAKKIAILCY